MRKLSNTEAELKRALLIKKSVYFFGTSNEIPSRSWCESVFKLFFVPS